MAFLSSMNIVASGMTAQQLRLDVISENVTNINTTRIYTLMSCEMQEKRLEGLGLILKNENTA